MISVYEIDASKCNGCGRCLEACPQDAIYLVDGLANIDYERCTNCGICETVCKRGAIQSVADSEMVVQEKTANVWKKDSGTSVENQNTSSVNSQLISYIAEGIKSIFTTRPVSPTTSKTPQNFGTRGFGKGRCRRGRRGRR